MSPWPQVPLGEVLRQVRHTERVSADREYPNFGIYSFGRGLFRKQPISGQTSSASTLYKARVGQIVYSRLFAFEGAYALVGSEFDGHFVSNEYPLFDAVEDRAVPEFILAYLRRQRVWEELAKRASGMGDRRRRVQPEQLLRFEIPLPPLPEQRRVVARIEEVAGLVGKVREIRSAQQAEIDSLLSAAFWSSAASAPRARMRDVAPLTRRVVAVSPSDQYPEVGIRSFGKGTFHKPALSGLELGGKRIFRIERGDLLFSNVFAWEGAVAVATASDEGRYGSHRFMTCVPIPAVATANYLRFYFLTAEGLGLLQSASPGGAGRNRTLGVEALQEILVPIPPVAEQSRFDTLFQEVVELERSQQAVDGSLDALLPAVIDCAFRGEL